MESIKKKVIWDNGCKLTIDEIITQHVVEKTIKKLEQQLDFGIQNPILEVDCGGGDISCMQLFYWLQDHSQVIVRVNHRCRSAAIIVLLAATIRECVPTSSFLLHLGKSGKTDITPDDYFDPEWRNSRRNYILMSQITATRLRLSENEYVKWVYPERILDAKQALECGLVTRIITKI